MLGDVFVKFTTQLRAYTNFLNNYPVTLQTLERVSDSGNFLSEFSVCSSKTKNRILSMRPTAKFSLVFHFILLNFD